MSVILNVWKHVQGCNKIPLSPIWMREGKMDLLWKLNTIQGALLVWRRWPCFFFCFSFKCSQAPPRGGSFWFCIGSSSNKSTLSRKFIVAIWSKNPPCSQSHYHLLQCSYIGGIDRTFEWKSQIASGRISIELYLKFYKYICLESSCLYHPSLASDEKIVGWQTHSQDWH